MRFFAFAIRIFGFLENVHEDHGVTCIPRNDVFEESNLYSI